MEKIQDNLDIWDFLGDGEEHIVGFETIYGEGVKDKPDEDLGEEEHQVDHLEEDDKAEAEKVDDDLEYPGSGDTTAMLPSKTYGHVDNSEDGEEQEQYNSNVVIDEDQVNKKSTDKLGVRGNKMTEAGDEQHDSEVEQKESHQDEDTGNLNLELNQQPFGYNMEGFQENWNIWDILGEGEEHIFGVEDKHDEDLVEKDFCEEHQVDHLKEENKVEAEKDDDYWEYPGSMLFSKNYGNVDIFQDGNEQEPDTSVVQKMTEVEDEQLDSEVEEKESHRDEHSENLNLQLSSGTENESLPEAAGLTFVPVAKPHIQLTQPYLLDIESTIPEAPPEPILPELLQVKKEAPETDDSSTLANEALTCVQATSEVKTDDIKKPIWCDVGIIEGTSFHVRNYHEPPFAHDPEHETITSDNLPDIINSLKINLEPGTKYKFRICAINSCGRGPWSEASVFKTRLPGYPGIPSSIKISKSASGAHVTWEPPLNPSGTIIEYSLGLAMRKAAGLINQAIHKEKNLIFVRIYIGPSNKIIVPNSMLKAAVIDTTSKPAMLFRLTAKNENGYGPSALIRWLQDDDVTSTSKKSILKKKPISSRILIKKARIEES